MSEKQKLIVDYKNNPVLAGLVKEAMDSRDQMVSEAKFHTKALEKLKKKASLHQQEWWRRMEAELEAQGLCGEDVDPSKLCLKIDEEAGLIRETEKSTSGLEGLMRLMGMEQ